MDLVHARSVAPGLGALLAARGARVAVVGLGHVGLPLAAGFAERGYAVVGFDVDRHRVESLRGRRFAASTDPSALRGCHAALIAVPTPVDARGAPDFACVDAAVETVAEALFDPAGGAGERLIAVCSTLDPGGARRRVAAPLAARGLAPRARVCASPERADPGGARSDPRSIPRLVGGIDARSTALGAALFEGLGCPVVRVASAEVAELAKLHENTFRAVNIALVNELAETSAALSIDVEDVLAAAATKGFGYMGFEPGPGIGGPCIPVQPRVLAWSARQAGARAELAELAAELAVRRPRRIVEAVERELARRGARLAGARVLVLGLAYKRGVADLRGSPALALLRELGRRGALASWHDPLVHAGGASPAPAVADELGTSCAVLDAALVRRQQALVVATDQTAIDWELVAREAPLVVDARGTLWSSMRRDPRYVRA